MSKYWPLFEFGFSNFAHQTKLESRNVKQCFTRSCLILLGSMVEEEKEEKEEKGNIMTWYWYSKAGRVKGGVLYKTWWLNMSDYGRSISKVWWISLVTNMRFGGWEAPRGCVELYRRVKRRRYVLAEVLWPQRFQGCRRYPDFRVLLQVARVFWPQTFLVTNQKAQLSSYWR